MTDQAKKHPPIPIRDSGGSFAISNPDDGTPIREMFELNGGLLMITDKCTYKMQVADQIDPDRKNPTLSPNFQQKLFDHGIKSELLCRTLLQAKVMFRKEFQSVNVNSAKGFSFDALGELIALHEAEQAFKSAEQSAIVKAQSLTKKDMSQTIPAVGNVQAHCKTFSQKADHFAKALFEIVRLFYPETKNWDNFQELVKSRYGENDSFFKVLEIAVPILKLVRETRNCLDKVNLGGVQTKDFEPQADGSVAPPTIKVDFRGSVQERCSISSFMEGVAMTLVDAFEMIIIHMCSKSVQPFAGLQMTVALLPENYREAWHVRFAYGSYYQDGQFVPCG